MKIIAYGIRLKNERIKYYAWENHLTAYGVRQNKSKIKG